MHRVSLARKSLYSLLAFLVLTFILAAVVPSFVHTRDWDKAYDIWRKSPTPENEAAFRVQQRKHDLVHLEDSAIGALVLVALGLSAYGGVRLAMKYLKRSEPNGA